MDQIVIRPSLAAYETSWPQRKRQALAMGAGSAGVIILVAVRVLMSGPSIGPLVLLLLGAAVLCVVGIFGVELAYIRNARITLQPGGLRISGVPLTRARTSPLPAVYQRATIDFGRQVERRAWEALDGAGRPLFWLYADFWEEADIDRLAGSTGAGVSGSWATVVSRPRAPQW